VYRGYIGRIFGGAQYLLALFTWIEGLGFRDGCGALVRGVGHKLERELGARGLRTAAHVRSVPRATLCAWLGARVGALTHDAAWGVDRQHVAEKPPPAAVTCEAWAYNHSLFSSR